MSKYTFHITEKSIQKCSSWGFLLIPLSILISPFLIFYVVLLIVWYGLKNVWASIANKGKPITLTNQTLPQITLQTKELQIKLQEADSKFYLLVDDWYNITYDDDELFYKAVTQPIIEGIDGALITGFFWERDNGVFLQKIIFEEYADDPLSIGSKLVWIDYKDMRVKVSQEIGPYFLREKDMEKNQIIGTNGEKEICISITKT